MIIRIHELRIFGNHHFPCDLNRQRINKQKMERKWHSNELNLFSVCDQSVAAESSHYPLFMTVTLQLANYHEAQFTGWRTKIGTEYIYEILKCSFSFRCSTHGQGLWVHKWNVEFSARNWIIWIYIANAHMQKMHIKRMWATVNWNDKHRCASRAPREDNFPPREHEIETIFSLISSVSKIYT